MHSCLAVCYLTGGTFFYGGGFLFYAFPKITTPDIGLEAVVSQLVSVWVKRWPGKMFDRSRSDQTLPYALKLPEISLI